MFTIAIIDSDDFVEYIEETDGSGCDFGIWLSEMLVNVKQ